jgi:hypothetical protein
MTEEVPSGAVQFRYVAATLMGLCLAVGVLQAVGVRF